MRASGSGQIAFHSVHSGRQRHLITDKKGSSTVKLMVTDDRGLRTVWRSRWCHVLCKAFVVTAPQSGQLKEVCRQKSRLSHRTCYKCPVVCRLAIHSLSLYLSLFFLSYPCLCSSVACRGLLCVRLTINESLAFLAARIMMITLPVHPCPLYLSLPA